MKSFFRKRTQPIIDPFRLWHSYRAIGEEVLVVIASGDYDEDEIDLIATKHQAINYQTEPMTTQQLKKVRITK